MDHDGSSWHCMDGIGQGRYVDTDGESLKSKNVVNISSKSTYNCVVNRWAVTCSLQGNDTIVGVYGFIVNCFLESKAVLLGRTETKV